MSGFVTGFTYIATGISASGMMGVAGLAYGVGPIPIIGIIIAFNAAVALSFFYVAPQLREFSERHRCLTIPDYFAARLQTPYARLIPAVLIIIFLIPMMVVQFSAAGLVFSSVMGMDYTAAVLLFGVIIAAYVAVGGYLAVAYTDTAQGIIMLVGLIYIPFVAVSQAGGFSAMLDGFARADAALLQLWGKMGPSRAIGVLVSFFIGVFGLPQLLQRFFAIRNSRRAMAGALMIAVILEAALILTIIAGVAGRVIAPEIDRPDRILIVLMTYMPAFLAAFFTAALLSAMMSTVDSVLLVVGSAVANDIYGKHIARVPSEETLLWVGRGATVVVAALSMALALKPPQFITLVMAYAFGGLGILIAVPLIATMFWSGTTAASVLAAWIVGLVSYVGWELLGQPMAIPTAVFSLVVTVLALVFTAWFTAPRAQPRLVRAG